MLSLDKQNEWRERYAATRAGWRPATEQYAAWVREWSTGDRRLLDLGCGRGGLVEQLGKPLRQVVGIDPDLASLQTHRLTAMPKTAAFSDHLPFAPTSFDVVFTSWLFEHLERPLLTFQAVRRVRKPGGVFIFITPNGRHPLNWLNATLGRLGRLQGQLVEQLYDRDSDDTFPTFYRANSAANLQRLAAQADFALHALHTVPDPTYLAFTAVFYRLSCLLENNLPPSRHIHLVGVLQAS